MPGISKTMYLISSGLFATDPAGTRAQKTRQLVSRFTWELPNTLVAVTIAITLAMAGKVHSLVFYHGATFIRLKDRRATNGYYAFTIGSYIVGSQGSTPLLRHEYGHCLQSMVFGPLYLLIIGIPSLASAAVDIGRHHTRWFERDADARTELFHRNLKR
ncbi:MAG: hypothetical protein V4649_14740 [Bacteroidota bacterium]